MSQLAQRISRWLQANGLFSSRIDLAKDQAAPLGLLGERLVAKYLNQLGYRVVAHGHRQRLGEIDLIALDGQCVVFVEVKTWASDAQGDPSMAVDRNKQEKITRAALIYLKQHRLLNQPARFDVVSVVWNGDHSIQPKIRHFQSAFEAVGTRQFFS
jgi:putative endonuclease